MSCHGGRANPGRRALGKQIIFSRVPSHRYHTLWILVVVRVLLTAALSLSAWFKLEMLIERMPHTDFHSSAVFPAWMHILATIIEAALAVGLWVSRGAGLRAVILWICLLVGVNLVLLITGNANVPRNCMGWTEIGIRGRMAVLLGMLLLAVACREPDAANQRVSLKC